MVSKYRFFLIGMVLYLSCSLPVFQRTHPVIISLDSLQVSFLVPKKGYLEQEQQIKEDMASVSFECPTIIVAGEYSITPVFTINIEKSDSPLDPVIYNNRSRAIFEAKTMTVLNESQRLLGSSYIESIQERRYGKVLNTIYQATTTQGNYGIRVVYQVPSEVFDQGIAEFRSILKTIRISKKNPQ